MAIALALALALAVRGAPLAGAARPCFWVADTDYRGINNTRPHELNIRSKEACCARAQALGYAFAVYNPSASGCFFKNRGAVPFHNPGDVACCPIGEPGCPSPPDPSGRWRLVPEFSDEFAAGGDGALLPLNTSKWNTSVASWGAWSWDPSNVRVVSTLGSNEPLPAGVPVRAEVAASYAAIGMRYEEHERGNTTLYYKSGIMRSTLPAGITHGRFEARIRGASRWPGVCPAFWAYRHSESYWTELDFVEMLESPRSIEDIDFTSHVFPPTPNVDKEISNATHASLGFNPQLAFHTYAMEWNASRLTWWVDGRVVKEQPAAPYFNESWPMDVAVSFGLRHPLTVTPSMAGFPTTFWVDWIRTWQRTPED